MQHTAESASKPIGVIDSLQGGFNLVNRRPWLLLLPVIVDLVLWRGPKLSLAPLFQRAQELIFSQPELPAEFAESAELASETMLSFGDSFNLLSLLSGAVIGFPSYLSRIDAASTVSAGGSVIELTSVSTVLLYAVGLILVGLLFGSIWLALIVHYLKDDLNTWRSVFGRIGWIWLNAALFLAAIILLFLAVSGFLGILLTMLALVAGSGGLALVAILQMAALLIVVWISIGLSLTISAIALDGINAARAVWRSLNVVGRNLSSTLGLLVIGLVLTEGFARIWLIISSNDWGVPIGILGTAYIGTALITATLLFYRGRYQHWQQIRSSLVQARRTHQDDNGAN